MDHILVKAVLLMVYGHDQTTHIKQPVIAFGKIGKLFNITRLQTTDIINQFEIIDNNVSMK